MKPGKVETNQLTPEIEQRFASMQGKIEQFASRAEAAEGKLASMEQRQQVGDRYMALRAKAASLNTDGKLSAHAFRTYFPADEQFSTAVERFSAAPTAQSAEGEKPTTLDEIDAALTYLEKFGTAIKTGSVAGADLLEQPKAEGELDATGLADAERYIKNHREMSAEEKKEALAALRPAA